VSDHADKHRIVSSKQSPLAGRWRTDSNPILREPMDCLSKHSTVQDVTLKFPIQIGKTEVGVNWICYTMDHDPAPMMVCLPGEASQAKWLQQKLQPTIEVTECMQRSLTSTSSRNAANRAEFKDFAGGQLMIEHAGQDWERCNMAIGQFLSAHLPTAPMQKCLLQRADHENP
jgi:phage terminase large subunit GpA-like protein